MRETLRERSQEVSASGQLPSYLLIKAGPLNETSQSLLAKLRAHVSAIHKRWDAEKSVSSLYRAQSISPTFRYNLLLCKVKVYVIFYFRVSKDLQVPWGPEDHQEMSYV